MKTQNKDKSCTIYNNEPCQIVESFKYHGFDFPSIIFYGMDAQLTTSKYERELTIHLRTYALEEMKSNIEFLRRHFGDTSKRKGISLSEELSPIMQQSRV